MSPVVFLSVSGPATLSNGIETIVDLPVKHNPLGGGSNAVVALIEGREPCENSVVVVSHLAWRITVGSTGGAASVLKEGRICFVALAEGAGRLQGGLDLRIAPEKLLQHGS
jgi:hypothetical protein